MKKEKLGDAATDLWFALEDIGMVYGDLEDDDGGLGRRNRVLEEKFDHVCELLEDLATHVHRADPGHAKRDDTPPWGERKNR
jgi:hypothetical protein